MAASAVEQSYHSVEKIADIRVVENLRHLVGLGQNSVRHFPSCVVTRSSCDWIFIDELIFLLQVYCSVLSEFGALVVYRQKHGGTVSTQIGECSVFKLGWIWC